MKIFVFYGVFIFFLILMVSCEERAIKNKHNPPDYIIIADRITKQVQTKIINKYINYKIRAIGESGAMFDGVNLLGLKFEIHGPITKDELRIMLVDSVEEFLANINSNEEIRPFLINYPFTSNEIEIDFYINDKNGGDIYDPDISVAYSAYGKLHFRTVDKDNVYGYKVKEEEDYEVAKKIVQETQKK